MGSSCHQVLIGIGFEPSSKASLLCCSTVQNILGIILRIIDDHLLIREMDWQAVDRGPFQMHWEFKDAPHSLSRADVSGVKICFDLIHRSFHLQGSPVMSFVDVLVDVLDRLDGCTDLHVDMTVELHQQVWRMRNNIFVGEDIAIRLLDGAAIFRSCILWIAILLHDGLSTEGLWVMLLAKSILQATFWSAGTMEHEFADGFIELWMDVLVRNLGRDEGVDLLCSMYLGLWLKKDEEMHVGETALLIFDGVHQSSNLSKVAIANLLQESLLLLVEYASHQVWTIHRGLTFITHQRSKHQ
jgi:hypothetical protein